MIAAMIEVLVGKIIPIPLVMTVETQGVLTEGVTVVSVVIGSC